MTKLVFLDQNAWIALARGSWDKVAHPKEYLALTRIVELVRSGSIIAPLTYANIYETIKINDHNRRANIGRVQSVISGGRVFRGRRRIFHETLSAYIAEKLMIPRPAPERHWFLSDLWFEAAADYSPDTNGFELSSQVLEFVRRDPAAALFDYLINSNETVRMEAVRQFSASSTELIAGIEVRRAIANRETLALRKRAYGARLVLDEIDFILTTGQQLGLDWRTARDVGPSMIRSIVLNIPILNVERELAVRLEAQSRDIAENDLRDMGSFIIALPLADIIVAEKPFVNLARQARLGETYRTKLMTSIFDFNVINLSNL